MNKKLLNSMFIAAGLLMANGAWADQTVTHDFEGTETVFTGDSRLSLSLVSADGVGEGNTTQVLKITGAGNAQNGYSFAHYDISSLVTKATNVKISFDAYFGSGARNIVTIGDATVRGKTGGSSKITYNKTGAAFRIGSDKNNSLLNGNTSAKANYTDKWITVTVDFDLSTSTYSYTVKTIDGATTISEGADVAYYADDVANISQIDIFGYINNSVSYLDNVKVEVTESTAAYANYTLKYVNEDNEEIADSKSGTAEVGQTVTVPAALTPDITKDDQKYIFSSSDAATVTVAEDGSSVITLTYRKAATYNYTVKTSLGTTIATGSDFEGNSVAIAYPRFILDGTTLYQKAAQGSEYRQKITLTQDNQEDTFDYTEYATNGYFFAEAEDIDGLTSYEDEYTQIRLSGGAGAYNPGEAVTVTTLPAGSYIISSQTRGSGTPVSVQVGDQTLELTSSGAVSSGNIEVTLTEATPVVVPTCGASGSVLDYILIQKTGEASYTKTVTTAGIATFSAPAAVTIPAGVTAYTAAVDGDNVVLTAVSGTVIPASTGVIIEAEAGDYTFNVTSEAASLTSALVATDVATTALTGDYGLNTATKTFVPVIAGGTYPANSAILRGISSAKNLNVVYADATGVKAIETVAEDNAATYNLAGQKVSASYKGIVIKNGKKYIK